MQTLPNGWVALFAAPHKTEYKLVINGVTYDMHQLQGTPVIAKPLMEKPVIGRVCSATLTATIRPLAGVAIPKSARVLAYCRLTDTDGTNPTDWLPQGRYYISTRDKNANVTITCRDDMLKSGQTYLDKTSLAFPISHGDAVTEIASLMGVDVDSRTELLSGDDYRITELDSDTTMSEILAGIAACNGGNWIMTEAGALRLVPFASPSGTPDQTLGKAYTRLTDLGSTVTVSRVTMTNDEGDSFTAGTDTGYTLSVQCPYATQTVVDALGSPTDGRLFGVTYLPYRCEKAFLNPAVELGDTIKLQNRANAEISVALHSISAFCNVGFTCTSESGAEAETEDEYPYSVQQNANDARVVRTDRKYYGNSITKIHGFRSVLDSGAYAEFNADGLEFVDENGKRCMYYDAEAQTFIMNGTLGADAIFTDSLYAEQGDIAQITTDRVDTSKRIKLYLTHDTSDDNHFVIQDNAIFFVQSKVKFSGSTPMTTYLWNRYGKQIYWMEDISDAEIIGGYPYIGDKRILTTTENTGYPVVVYSYDRVIKRQLSFYQDTDSGEWYPIDSFGEVDGTGNNTGHIYRNEDSLVVENRNDPAHLAKIVLGDYVDANHRRPTRFDFSGLADSGSTFTVTWDGDEEPQTYIVLRDGQGRIYDIIAPDLHQTEVVWDAATV